MAGGALFEDGDIGAAADRLAHRRGICARVAAEAETRGDRFANLRRIGIYEIAHRKGHRYLTVVVDHDTGLLVWAAPGHDAATLHAFFDLLGEERCGAIELVSAGGAAWIADVVAERCEKAKRCMDPFHVVAWATKALDEVRREVWNEARRQGLHAEAANSRERGSRCGATPRISPNVKRRSCRRSPAPTTSSTAPTS